MEIAHVEFDCIEFQDITGQYRLVHGYSLKNREELRSCLSELQKFLDSIHPLWDNYPRIPSQSLQRI